MTKEPNLLQSTQTKIKLNLDQMILAVAVFVSSFFMIVNFWFMSYMGLRNLIQ